MKKLLLFQFLLISLFIYSEDKEQEKDVVISIDRERSETLLYGIDSEVKELLVKLTKEKISGFNKELNALLENSVDESIKTAIFNYYMELDITEGENVALKIFDTIEYEDEYTDSYAAICLQYLSKIKSNIAMSKIGDLLNSENSTVLKSALKFISENDVKLQEQKLLEMFEDEETDDDIYIEVIKALGSIKSIKAIDLFIPIADDSDEETTIRNAICFSLGKIGNKKALPVLTRCLGDKKNYLLRKSALQALGEFSGSNIEDLLIESLRDPHWMIRFEAIKALGDRKVKKSFNILKYKALKDPEDKIKKEAFKAIGDINSDECREFLKEVYTGKSYTDSEKISAIDKLVEYNIDWIFPSILELYKTKNMEKRKPILDKTLQLVAGKEYKLGGELFEMMLNHENYVYKLYAIQGIRLNKLNEYKDKITELSEKDKNKNVKKHALSAIEEL